MNPKKVVFWDHHSRISQKTVDFTILSISEHFQFLGKTVEKVDFLDLPFYAQTLSVFYVLKNTKKPVWWHIFCIKNSGFERILRAVCQSKLVCTLSSNPTLICGSLLDVNRVLKIFFENCKKFVQLRAFWT